MNLKIYTTKELAKLFRVSDMTIRNEVERGKLKGFKIGNENRFTQHQIDEYMKIKDVGKTQTEIELEEEIRRLQQIIEKKNKIISDIKDMLLGEKVDPYK